MIVKNESFKILIYLSQIFLGKAASIKRA